MLFAKTIALCSAKDYDSVLFQKNSLLKGNKSSLRYAAFSTPQRLPERLRWAG